MLQTYKDIARLPLALEDEDFGSVVDMYFDDRNWRTRYVVADVGRWYENRQGLLEVSRVGVPNFEDQRVPVSLTKDEIKQAPPPETDPPVRDQKKAASTISALYLSHPGFIYSPIVAETQIARLMASDGEGSEDSEDGEGDPHLHAMSELLGYSIRATDEEIGIIDDIVVDPETWQIQFVVVDTGNWLPGKQVVVARESLGEVSWAERVISVSLDREAIKESPALSEVPNIEQDTTRAESMAFIYPV